MARYLVVRLFSVILVLWLAATLSFSLIHIVPGDPAEAALSQSVVSQDALEARREALGFDLPLGVQYQRFLANALSGNFGASWVTGQSVRVMLTHQLMPTIQLALVGTFFSLLIGAVLGTVAGAGPSSFSRMVSTALIVALIAVPIMFSATVLLWLLDSLALNELLSAQGGGGSLLLPGAVAGLAGAGTLALPVSVRFLETTQEQFILAARARGLSRSQLIFRHMSPHAVLAGLDVAALMVGYLLGGTVVTEMIFARPGLGRLLLSAVLNQDLPVVQAVVILSAVVYSLVNIVADLLRGWIDPRVWVF